MGRLRGLDVASVLLATIVASLRCHEVDSGVHAESLSREHLELATALDGLRPVEPRLVAFPGWQRCAAAWIAAPADDCAGSRRRFPELRRAGRRVEQAALRQPNSRTLHALGIWHLLQSGRRDRTELAVTRLEQATRYPVAEAELWSDLAAAYYARAQRLRRPEDLVRSLSACDHALRIAPELQPALFNRALALEALFLRDAAVATWQWYLVSADTPDWFGEARQHLANLRLPAKRSSLSQELRAGGPAPRDIQTVVKTDPFDAMQFTELHLLGEEATTFAGPRGRELARVVAKALLEVSHDRQLEDELHAWDEATRDPRGGFRRARLQAGYALFREARGLYEELDTQRAEPIFEQAARALSAGDSPLELWARYYFAVCRYWDGDLDAAAAAISRVRSAAGEAPYAILKGYASWMAGLIAANQSDFDEAMEHYETALANFDNAGLVQEAGFIRVLLAQVLHFVNDPRSAWDQLYHALANADTWRNQRWRQALFDEVATRISLLGEPETALYFQRRAVEAAVASGQAAVISEAHARHALALHRTGRAVAATAHVREARRWIGKITDPATRRQTEAVVLVAEARLQRYVDPEEALEHLTAAAADRVNREATSLLPELQLERARLLRQLGRNQKAEEALLAALAAVDLGSRSVESGQERSAYLAAGREVVDEMLRLQLEVKGDWRAAFLVAERARVQEFFTPHAGEATLPADLESLQKKVAPGRAILACHVLEDRLLLWLLVQDTLLFADPRVSKAELEELVENFVGGLRYPAPATVMMEWTGRLHEVLLAPFGGALHQIQHLTVVPDGPLFQLPFGALFDPESAQFLLERAVVVKALTSGLVAVGSPAALGDGPGRPPSVLAVGDPEFDAQRFGALARLPEARREAAAVARLYPDADLLLGAAATRARVLAKLGRHDVVHFASHAMPNADTPELSMLVLAPSKDGQDSGALYGKDIKRLSLHNTRLVVLAACSTTGNGAVRSEGFSALARPFLAAGAAVVIGSLWDVEDAASARFLTDLHQRLVDGAPHPAAALRATQEAQRAQSSASDHSWAAFEAYLFSPELE